MEQRYWLRFESGERSGERIAVPASGLTVGSRAGNDLQLTDRSVSGSHAELRFEGGDALLRDLDSTNGTRVGAERIEERSLAHGDRLRFGRVELVFLDRELEDGGAVPAARADERPDEAVRAVSAEWLARSGKRSTVAAAVLVLALVAGGLLLARRFLGGDEARGPRMRPVTPVEGDLLAGDYSFEPPAGGSARGAGPGPAGWSASEEAPATLEPGCRWRDAGTVGYGADLGPGEWALAVSDEVALRTGSGLRLTASVTAEGEAGARLGIRFRSTTAAGPELHAWGPLLSDESRGRAELAADVPPGYDRGRALLLAVSLAVSTAPRAGAEAEAGEEDGGAPAGGGAGFDDVALVQGAAAGSAVQSNEYELHLLGADPVLGAVLARIRRPILTDLHVRGGAALPGPRAGDAALGARVAATGLALEIGEPPAPPGSAAGGASPVLAFAVPAEVARAGVATLGEGGYRSHAAEFEAEGVTSLLLGADIGLVRLGFGRPVAVEGRPTDTGTGLQVALGDLRAVELQLVFREERDAARGLAAQARRAEEEERLGQSLRSWGELLARFPYERELVREAENARSRLIEAGLSAVRAVEQDVVRSAFFELADLHRECRARAVAVAQRYAGSEVEEAAQLLIQSIDVDLARMESDYGGTEARRIATILEVLRERGASSLAAHVEGYLEGRGDAPDGAAAGAGQGDI